MNKENALDVVQYLFIYLMFTNAVFIYLLNYCQKSTI